MSHNVIVDKPDDEVALSSSNPRDDVVSTNKDPGRISGLDECDHVGDGTEESFLSEVEREVMAEVDEYVQSIRREFCMSQNDDSADESKNPGDSNSEITPDALSTSSAPTFSRSPGAPKSRKLYPNCNEDPDLRAYLESCARAQDELVRAFDIEMDDMTRGLQVGLDRIVEDLETDRRRRQQDQKAKEGEEEEGEISKQ